MNHLLIDATHFFFVESVLPGLEDGLARVLLLFVEADHMVDVDFLVETVHDAHLRGVHATVLMGAVAVVVMVIMASHCTEKEQSNVGQKTEVKVPIALVPSAIRAPGSL